MVKFNYQLRCIRKKETTLKKELDSQLAIHKEKDPGEYALNNLLYIVNVEAAIYKDDKWLIIKRSELEEHAPGELSLVGGKVEGVFEQEYVLEETVKREIREEVGIEIYDNPLYVESKAFSIGKGVNVIDIVFLCRYRSGNARGASPEEVSEVHWYSTREILDNEKAPDYLKDSIRKAESLRLSKLQ
jgi:NADH pyrophosphatase NudC (nudix superfamily)